MTVLKKRVVAFLLLVLTVAFVCAGCGNDTGYDRLPRKQVRELQAYWLEQYNIIWPLEWHDEMYLGTYNGYIVFVENQGYTDEPYEFTLKGETFRADFDFIIYLFKDREFFALDCDLVISELRPDGGKQRISDEDVRAIAERFRAYVQWYESQERE